MNIIFLACACFLMIPLFFIRLLADARMLRNRLCVRPAKSSEEVQEREEPLIRVDYAMWTAPPFCKVEAASGWQNVQFYSPDSERPGSDEASGQVLETETESSGVTS